MISGMDGHRRRGIHRRATGAPGRLVPVILLGFLCSAEKGGCGSDGPVTIDLTPDAGSDGSPDGTGDGAGDAGRRKPRPGDPCKERTDCDDGVFCNGVEECVSGICISPRNAACRDPGGCATATCQEDQGGCAIDPTPPAAGTCDAGSVCLADLGCTKVEGCTSASDPRCDDGRACTDDVCDVASGRCLHLPVDARCPAAVSGCGRGLCLGDKVAEPSGCGATPDASRCGEGFGCDATLACVSLPTTCTWDEDCTDHTLCDGIERCVLGRCVHGERTTCVARDSCHRAVCRERALGDPYCVETKLPRCP
jgi:hypothetical protein